MEVVAKGHHENKASIAQVAVNWLLGRPTVAGIIIGPRSIDHLEDLMNAASWALTTNEQEKLTALSDVDVPHPWEMVWRCSARGAEA